LKPALETLLPVLGQYGLLPQLLRELVIDGAIADVSLSPEAELAACQTFYQQHQLKTEADVQVWLQQRGIQRDQLMAIITRPARIAAFQQATWGSQVDSYFLERKPTLDRVVYSLIRVKELGLAQELYFRLQEGEQSFEQAARAHSQGVEAETGGLLGPVELSVPHAAIAQLLSTASPGQLLPPTRIGDWYTILRLEKRLLAQLDEATEQRLLDEQWQKWLQNQVSQIL
jgi:parvulin-like peptidyl-prolyl isomerase